MAGTVRLGSTRAISAIRGIWANQRAPLREALAYLALCLLVWVAFAPALHNGFVDYDDEQYVTENPIVNQGLTWDGVRGAATANVGSNWHPLTLLSHMLDIELFGLWAGGHHMSCPRSTS